MEKKKCILEVEEDPTTIRLVKLKNGEGGLPCMQFMAVSPYKYDEAYQRGVHDTATEIEAIKDEAYKRGLKDMYEKIHKVLEMPLEDKRICFGETYTNGAIKRYDATTFVSLLNAYERKKQEEQITIGDEVVFYNGERCVVTVIEDGQVTEVMDENGFSMKMEDGLRNSMKKTGRHFEELVTILKKMKGE